MHQPIFLLCITLNYHIKKQEEIIFYMKTKSNLELFLYNMS